MMGGTAHDGGTALVLPKRGQRCLFHNSIIGNFMVYQN